MNKKFDEWLTKSFGIPEDVIRKSGVDFDSLSKSKKEHLVPVKKIVNRNGKAVQTTVYVNPNKEKEHEGHKHAQQKASNDVHGGSKMSKQEAKDMVKALKEKHGTKGVVELAENNGLEWSRNPDYFAHDYMRCAMALSSHFQKGGKLSEKVSKDSTDVKSDVNNDEPSNVGEQKSEKKTREQHSKDIKQLVKDSGLEVNVFEDNTVDGSVTFSTTDKDTADKLVEVGKKAGYGTGIDQHRGNFLIDIVPNTGVDPLNIGGKVDPLFKKDHFDVRIRKTDSGREVLLIEGVPKKMPETDDGKNKIKQLRRVESKREFMRLWRKWEDNNQLQEVGKIMHEINDMYELKSTLFNVPGYSYGFGRLDTEKLGKNINNMKSDLSPSESQSILNYTGSQSSIINESARKGKPEEAGEIIQHLDNAISKSTLTKDVILHRGANYAALGKELAMTILQGNPKDAVGATIQDDGFMSTSLGAASRFKSDVVFQIKAPKGTTGMYVEEHTATMGEHEVILPRGTKMKVEDVTVKDGKIHMLMGVV
jgi:ADP-ribosyltransferase exoenzyme